MNHQHSMLFRLRDFPSLPYLRLLFALLLLLILPGSVDAETIINYKISGTMPAGGDVWPYQISPDSSRVVFRARPQDIIDWTELYSVPLGGGPVTKLNEPLVSDRIVSSFQISPDSSRVVYLIEDPYTAGVSELYSVPLEGGPVTKLNGDELAWSYQISPDSSRVVYVAEQEAFEVSELYSVPLGGGLVTKLNGPLVSGGEAWSFEISPDSSRVVYRADQEIDEVFELYSVPLGGGSVTKLNAPLVSKGDVYADHQISPQISPDSSWVVYVADQEIDNVFELYSVPLGGGLVTKLNGPLVSGGNVDHRYQISPQISPDSSRVVYRADQEIDNVFELYSVPLGGGSVTKLNASLVSSGDVLKAYQISPDSSTVVYRADQEIDEVDELYSVPLGGGPVIKLNDSLVNSGDVLTTIHDSPQISPDSSRVVYRADQEIDEVFELYSVPLGGGPVIKLNDPLVSKGDVLAAYQISPDSSRVVYNADQDKSGVDELYSVPLGGGPVTKLNGPLVSGGDVDFYDRQISSDSSRVVYRADQEIDGVNELFVAYYGGSKTHLPLILK